MNADINDLQYHTFASVSQIVIPGYCTTNALHPRCMCAMGDHNSSVLAVIKAVPKAKRFSKLVNHDGTGVMLDKCLPTVGGSLA